MIRLWLAGLLRRQPARLLAAASGVGVAVALLACLGSFLASAQATMTDRAVRTVAVDWQVQLTPGADTATVTRLLDNTPGVRGHGPGRIRPHQWTVGDHRLEHPEHRPGHGAGTAARLPLGVSR